jgi:hypothetical protein
MMRMMKVVLAGLCLVAGTCSVAATAQASALNYATTDPEIEMWFYPFSTANGVGSVRDRGAAFSWYTPQEGFPDITGSGTDPSQRGVILVASDTSATIPKLADPTKYRIDSLRVTMTMLGSIGSGVGTYDGSADDYAAVVAGNDADAGHPVEMWGVGFGGAESTLGYSTFGFTGESGAEYFNSGDRRWPISGGSFTGPYQIYAIDGAGNDVSNAISGGYSATAVGNTTAPFAPTPFAVGKVYDELGAEVAAGSSVSQGTEFVFEPNLEDAALVSYVQNSLAAGHLGFFFASLDEPNGHSGDVFYPDFYLDNVPNGPNPYGNAPTIELSVTILPDEPLLGDYDESGVVDVDDYATWKAAFGSAVAAGTGADGNGDGIVDAADYSVWRDNLGGGVGGNAGVAAVPEPGTILLLVVTGVMLAMQRRAQG